jgi:hypothetical protein
MLTLFTTPKPFLGHSAVIQRNALKSWTLLHPDIEVILFGNDEGAADIAHELGIRHEPLVGKDAKGNKRLDYLFGKAQEIAKHELLCYVNCDILLMHDFWRALECVKEKHTEFLMVGRRWDVDITELLSFEDADWQCRLREFVMAFGKRRTPDWIDYFVFTRGLYRPGLPPFVIGRVFWDNWLLWKARNSKHPVVDASASVIAVHQNHNYDYHPQGKHGVFHGEESGRNYRLAGGWRHLRTIEDATEILRAEGLKSNPRRHWVFVKRHLRQAGRVLLYDVWLPVWFFLLGITRPFRDLVGLRAGHMPRSRSKA